MIMQCSYLFHTHCKWTISSQVQFSLVPAQALGLFGFRWPPFYVLGITNRSPYCKSTCMCLNLVKSAVAIAAGHLSKNWLLLSQLDTRQRIGCCYRSRTLVKELVIQRIAGLVRQTWNYCWSRVWLESYPWIGFLHKHMDLFTSDLLFGFSHVTEWTAVSNETAIVRHPLHWQDLTWCGVLIAVRQVADIL